MTVQELIALLSDQPLDMEVEALLPGMGLFSITGVYVDDAHQMGVPVVVVELE